MPALFDAPLVCPILVGRAQHRDAIAQALAAAAGGNGRTLLLAGEAGIGKSRLVAEARALAAQRGFLVLLGRTFETDRALPYGPLVDLLRNYVDPLPAEEVAAAVGSDAPELVRLLPELASHVPGGASLPSLDAEQDKRRLFHAVAGFLLRHAATRPLLLVVEDAHWADDTTLEFLAYFARQLTGKPILLLITYRSDEVGPALRHCLTELDRSRLAVELRLNPLSLAEVEAMLRAIFGRPHPVGVDLLHALYSLTEGNPFFIEEVLRSLGGTREDALERTAASALRIPRSVQDAVQRRLAALSPAARETLALAAVAGQRWDFDLLQELTGQDETDLLAVVKELIAAQLVVEESADRFAFRHALTREAVYAELLARERRALHGRIARTIEQQRAAVLDTYLPDLCYHYAEAGDWEHALEYGCRAGEHAQALYAPHAAVEHFSRAIHAAGCLGRPVAPLLRARGSSYEVLGDFEHAAADYERALADARATGDHHEEWHTLHALGFLWAGRDYHRSGAYFQEALQRAREIGDPRPIAQSLNRVGNWRMNLEEPLEAQRLHSEALTIFRAADDTRGVAETLDLLGMASWLGCNMDVSATYYAEAEVHFRALDERRGLAAALLGRGCLKPHIQNDTLAVPPGTTGRQALEPVGEALALVRAIGWRAAGRIRSSVWRMRMLTPATTLPRCTPCMRRSVSRRRSSIASGLPSRDAHSVACIGIWAPSLNPVPSWRPLCCWRARPARSTGCGSPPVGSLQP